MKLLRVFIFVGCTAVLIAGIAYLIQSGKMLQLMQYYGLMDSEHEETKELVQIPRNIEFEKGEIKEIIYPKKLIESYWKGDSETIDDVVQDFEAGKQANEYFFETVHASDDSVVFTLKEKQLKANISITENELSKWIRKAEKDGMTVTISEDLMQVEYFLQEGCRMTLYKWSTYNLLINSNLAEAQIQSGMTEWNITQTVQREEVNHPMLVSTLSEEPFSWELTGEDWNEGLEIPIAE